nr:MAG TPA: hypothetical protein [Crassvirales sp.]
MSKTYTKNPPIFTDKRTNSFTNRKIEYELCTIIRRKFKNCFSHKQYLALKKSIKKNQKMKFSIRCKFKN